MFYTKGMIFRYFVVLLALSIQACGGSDSNDEPSSYLVSTSTSSNGSLAPESQSVAPGEAASFSVSVVDGYQLDSISGCDGSLVGETYTTGAVSADCTISASFSQISGLTVSTEAGSNGTISAGSVVNWGDTVMVTVSPEATHVIDSVTGCNGVLSGNTYTTGPITADCTVSATFSQIPSYTVSTQAGPNGTISAGSVVNLGDTVMITVTPVATFGIDSVTGCNGVLSGNTYTTGPITADCTVSASFGYTLSTVTPLYDVNGVNWNDYIKNDGVDALSAGDVAADGTETGGYSSVIHGGEFRQVQVTGKTSCTGLTAQDELDAFEWVCINATNPVTMVSSGLKQGKYLSDLIDFTGGAWKQNRVTVFENSVELGKSPSETWWANPVVIDNDGSDGSDITVGDIRIATIDTSASYIITQDKVAFVTDPAVTLSSDTSFPVVRPNNNNYIWVEGNFTGQPATTLLGTDFSVVQNITVNTCSGNGVSLDGSHNNFVNDISAENCTSYAVYLSESTNNVINQVRASGDNFAKGVGVGLNANDNTISNITAYDLYSGIVMGENSGNHISKVYVSKANTAVDLKVSYGVNTLSELSLFNNYIGVRFDRNSEDYVVSQVTTANNFFGIYYDNAASSNVVMQATAVNTNHGLFADIINVGPADIQNNTIVSMVASNNNTGLRLYYTYLDPSYYSVINTTISDYVGANNNYGIWLSRPTGNYFTGTWKLGNNLTNDCLLEFLAVTDGMLTDCTPQSPSDFMLTLDVTTQNSFVGKIASNDNNNLSDTTGSADYPAVVRSFDWTNFENFYRGWGIDGSVFPNADQRQQWNSGAGRIWDWSLKSTDTVLRNVLSLPTGNDTLTHTWGDATTTTFLRNAVEIAQDGIGNDNGLCESNETCLFTPNIASYQGHGDQVSAGSFTNGALTGITLVKYSVNGR